MADPSPSTGSDKLLEDALREDEEEARLARRRRSQEQMANDTVWDGDERVQDTILRMLMDKHQPLRVRGGATPSPHPADAKLSTVQQPTRPGGAPSQPPEVQVVQGPYEDGRFLPRTPPDQPWNAVYVSPVRAQVKEGVTDARPSSSASTTSSSAGTNLSRLGARGGILAGSTGRPEGRTLKERLKALGVSDAKRLPVDDAKKMRALRDGLRRFERAGRLGRAREGAFDYQRQKDVERALRELEEEAEREEEEMRRLDADDGIRRVAADGGGKPADQLQSDEGAAVGDEDGHRTKLQQRGLRKGGASLAAMGTQAWASLVNERIEEAMRGESWKVNSLRGKPLAFDEDFANPFMGSEERIMNRLVQRQGGAPPFVSLNQELTEALNAFRDRLVDSWVRRASRMILSSHLKDGLEPLSSFKSHEVKAAAAAAEKRASSPPETAATAAAAGSTTSASTATPELSAESPPTPGQARLLELAGRFRDAEWEAAERGYHDASLRELNALVRRYNAEAPFSARRPPLEREHEVRRALRRAQARLAQTLSDGLVELRREPEVARRRRRDALNADGSAAGVAEKGVWAQLMASMGGWAGGGGGGAEMRPSSSALPASHGESGGKAGGGGGVEVRRQIGYEGDEGDGEGIGAAGAGRDLGPDADALGSRRRRRTGTAGAGAGVLVALRVGVVSVVRGVGSAVRRVAGGAERKEEQR